VLTTIVTPWTIPPEITAISCRPNAFDFDSSGTLWASLKCSGSGNNFLVTVDENNGDMTFVENTVSELDGISFDGGPGPGLAVGSISIPIDSMSMLVAESQTFSWMIPVVLSVLGIGLFVVSRKSE